MAVEQIRPDRRPEQWCGPRRKILMSAQGLRFFSESPAALLVLLFQHHATSEMRGCLSWPPGSDGRPVAPALDQTDATRLVQMDRVWMVQIRPGCQFMARMMPKVMRAEATTWLRRSVPTVFPCGTAAAGQLNATGYEGLATYSP